MALGKDFKSALKDIGEMSYDERRKLGKTSPADKWLTYICIGIVVIFAIALFLHPTGGAG